MHGSPLSSFIQKHLTKQSRFFAARLCQIPGSNKGSRGFWLWLIGALTRLSPSLSGRPKPKPRQAQSVVICKCRSINSRLSWPRRLLSSKPLRSWSKSSRCMGHSTSLASSLYQVPKEQRRKFSKPGSSNQGTTLFCSYADYEEYWQERKRYMYVWISIEVSTDHG